MSRHVPTGAACSLASLLSVLLSSLAQAGEHPAETTLSIGYGDNAHIDLGGGNVREDITFVSLMISRAWVFRNLSRGRNLQLAIEGSASRARQEGEHRVAIGATPLLQYNFRSSGKIMPFAEAGLGLLYTDLDPERFGSRINFTPQVGAGIRYELSEEVSLRLAYRFHHISNAGLDADNNRSIDSHFLILGISLQR